MLLGVVSDTHGHVENAQCAVRMLESFAVAQVIHCGDLGSLEIPPLFQQWPTHFVFGNVDYDEAGLRRAIQSAGLTCLERFGELEIDSRRIAVTHGDDARRFRTAIESGKYDLVLYGHTHEAKIEQVGKSLVVNPGALYRARRHTIAIIDIEPLTATIVPV